LLSFSIKALSFPSKYKTNDTKPDSQNDICFNDWYDESREVLKARISLDYSHIFSFTLNWCYRKKYRDLEDWMRKRGRKEYTRLPLLFSIKVQQHSLNAICFPILLSDDPITYTCQWKEHINMIKHN
jgi:hypothetical protein